jgi:hypothetical protein
LNGFHLIEYSRRQEKKKGVEEEKSELLPFNFSVNLHPESSAATFESPSSYSPSSPSATVV